MGVMVRDGCLKFDGLLARLNKQSSRQMIRLNMELTHRCNFACSHCYCRFPEESKHAFKELDATVWERIISEAAGEGALLLLITGGEPLLHPGFQKIWVAAKRAGLIPELYTNGSLITPEIADFLAEWPPYQVSVTIYGSTDDVYEKVTDRAGMLSRVLDGIDLLRKRQVAVEVKGLFSRINSHDFDNVRELCLQYMSIFRWGAELTGPSCYSGLRPQDVGLSGDEIIDLERRDSFRSDAWRRVFADWKPPAEMIDTPFRCRVGQIECHVDPYGKLQPCMMLDHVGYDLLKGSVRDGWQSLPDIIHGITWQQGPCQRCELSEVCWICPAHALRLGGSAEGPTQFHCSLGLARAETFGLSAVPATHDKEAL